MKSVQFAVCSKEEYTVEGAVGRIITSCQGGLAQPLGSNVSLITAPLARRCATTSGAHSLQKLYVRVYLYIKDNILKIYCSAPRIKCLSDNSPAAALLEHPPCKNYSISIY